jgi:hypothetical protein
VFGYAKIERCCAQARRDNWEWAWIDSCCIDKTSSAELSEAINSMYQWYKDAQVCYAYLGDVNAQCDIPGELKKSAWFTRGWTLQELLAPEIVVFLDKSWIDIGTKGSLWEHISRITSIDDFRGHELACIAQKMSWACKRQTSRIEDEAYCLMGLFGVNMPLIYGEGRMAFRRLQMEIIKDSDDESIFAWASKDALGPQRHFFAPSPRSFEIFAHTKVLRRQPRKLFRIEKQFFTMTNKGLHISLFLIPLPLVKSEPQLLDKDLTQKYPIYVALLDCRFDNGLGGLNEDEWSMGILLVMFPDGKCSRIHQDKLLSVDLGKTETLCRAWSVTEKGVDFASDLNGPHGFNTLLAKNIYIKERVSLVSHLGFRIKTCEVLINITALRTHDFELQTNDCCGVDWHGSSEDVLRVSGVDYILSGDQKVYFTNAKTQETLEIRIGASYNTHPWLFLFTSSDLWRPPHPRSDDSDPMGVDRISLPLNNGTSVSASLRRVGQKPAPQYVVDLTIDPSGAIHWPLPPKLQKLMSLPEEQLNYCASQDTTLYQDDFSQGGQPPSKPADEEMRLEENTPQNIKKSKGIVARLRRKKKSSLGKVDERTTGSKTTEDDAISSK